MKNVSIQAMTIEQLVNRFVEIGVAQDRALLENNVSKYNRLFDQKTAVQAELKSRHGDQRRVLIELYSHENMQVRLNAVNATLAVAPQKARTMLQKIADSKFYPQAGYAGMSLLALEEGVYKPK